MFFTTKCKIIAYNNTTYFLFSLILLWGKGIVLDHVRNHYLRHMKEYNFSNYLAYMIKKKPLSKYCLNYDSFKMSLKYKEIDFLDIDIFWKLNLKEGVHKPYSQWVSFFYT